MMKKITALFLSSCMLFALAACAGHNAETGADPLEPAAPASAEVNAPGGAAPENQQTAESTEPAAKDNSDTAQSGSGEPAEDNSGNAAEDSGNPTEDGSGDTTKVLVAYFSATGTTRGAAQTIAESVGADLYEITPEQPYTDADLDYHDDNSRSTMEMNDPSARPAISGTVENMAQYEVVFIGYPIWWSDAPRILSTFVESYDFSGKTVVPFCTSGGSGIGSSAQNLETLTSGATWLPGTRLQSGADRSSIAEWINGLELGITAQ